MSRRPFFRDCLQLRWVRTQIISSYACLDHHPQRRSGCIYCDCLQIEGDCVHLHISRHTSQLQR